MRRAGNAVSSHFVRAPVQSRLQRARHSQQIANPGLNAFEHTVKLLRARTVQLDKGYRLASEGMVAMKIIVLTCNSKPNMAFHRFDDAYSKINRLRCENPGTEFRLPHSMPLGNRSDESP
jgi:hypothetical protein